MEGTTAEGRRVGRGDALEALTGLAERQRLLRTAYVSARYGWPESPACAWVRRPQSFGAEVEHPCRASRVLEALTSPSPFR